MSKFEKSTMKLINLVVIITGFIYFIYKYFMVVQGDYGVRPHSYTSTLLHAHILLVPIFVFIFGITFSSHVLPKLKAKFNTRKISGFSILLLFGFMTFSGYALQIGFDLKVNTVIGQIHMWIAGLWSLSFLYHTKQSK